MSEVNFEKVRKVYGGVVALEPLDLIVREGEFLTLLGPSGCGKTTTLRLIAGFVEPTSGKILLDGEDVTRLPPQRRSIGMVFQDYALFPHLTIAKNIAFALKERRVSRPKITARVGELLDLIQLPGYGDRYPAELSGGQQQRVALARAIAHSPRVLLMDEPLGALDLKLREAMQVEIRRIQRELRITTVYVTHDQSEAMTMSDRIAVMSQGRLVQLGSAEQIYASPTNRFVAGFVGKINLIPIRVVGKEGDLTVVEFMATRLHARAGSPDTDRTILAMRPEHVQFDASPANHTTNSLTGVVVSRSFSGNLIHATVRLANGQMLTVEARPGDRIPADGTSATVTWGASQTLLLRE